MEKMFSTMLGVGLVVLTSAGFIKSERPKHLLGLMNVDTQHSILRIPLTLILLHAGSHYASVKNARSALSLIGLVYLIMGLNGTVERRVGGLLPSKLTTFDLVYHFVVGASALWLGVRSGRMMKE